MAQGYPVKEEEQRKIWELHKLGYFPVVIARHLSDRYAHLNGGYRSAETVKDTIKMMEQREATMADAVPEELPVLYRESEKKKVPDMRKGNGKRK
jgi:hypothetical protein